MSRCFLHLSDIHFTNKLNSGGFDIDEDLRNELEIDGINVAKEFERIDGILISGDIAYSGQLQEYQVALDWLDSLSSKFGFDLGNVWTVPGNHDVQWGKIDSSDTIQQLHKSLKVDKPELIDDAIQMVLSDSTKKQLLYEPISNYVRDFASLIGCEIDADNPTWEYDFPLNDGSILRIMGINSALVSYRDDDDAGNKLLVGSFQSTLLRDDGVSYLTMCHHPLTWLRDHDNLDDHWNARASIQLYGHKHRQRIRKVGESVIISAGATHPYRREPGWQPRYNFINIEVLGKGDERLLKTNIFPRVWDPIEQKFQADFARDGSESREFQLRIDSWEPPQIRATAETPAELSQESEVQVRSKVSDESTIELSDEEKPMDPGRRLTYRFLRLSFLTRLRIAQKLELIQEEDEGKRDSELIERYFLRAKDREKLADLWVAVEEAHGDVDKSKNPFIVKGD